MRTNILAFLVALAVSQGAQITNSLAEYKTKPTVTLIGADLFGRRNIRLPSEKDIAALKRLIICTAHRSDKILVDAIGGCANVK